MIGFDPYGLAQQLGLLWGTHWMLTLFPAWMYILVPMVLSLGFMLFLRIFVEFRRPELHKQYKGLWPGDVFLSLSLGLLIVGMAFYASPVVSPFWRSPLWNAVTLLVVVVVVLALAIPEYVVAFRYRKRKFERPDYAYTPYQLHTPTALGHRVVMAVFTYLFMKVGAVAVATGAVPWELKLMALILFLCWAGCVVLDNFRTRPNLSDVHPASDAWFPFGRFMRRSSVAPVTPAPLRSDTSVFERQNPISAPPAPARPRRFDDTDPFGNWYGATERAAAYDPLSRVRPRSPRPASSMPPFTGAPGSAGQTRPVRDAGFGGDGMPPFTPAS